MPEKILQRRKTLQRSIRRQGADDRDAAWRIMEFKTGDIHFTEDESNAEIAVHLVLRARARMAEETVNGPEDSVATEMIKELPQRKGLRNDEILPRPLRWPRSCSKLLENYEIGVLKKARHITPKGDRKLPGDCAYVSDVDLVRDLHHFTTGEGKRTRSMEGSTCAWVELTGLAASSKCRYTGSGRGTQGKTLGKEARKDPRCMSPASTPRRPSVWQDRITFLEREGCAWLGFISSLT